MKVKTHKVAAKRIKVTAGGKLIRRHQGSRHLRLKKSKRRIRRFHEPAFIGKEFKRNIKRLLKR
ncbi:50S ribosomal protein L35 [Candidatus Gottesmanbacteria bacterium]|nr:50S ribosomal protein L35 [Candidatus Gottesmanbacteria bacterium]